MNSISSHIPSCLQVNVFYISKKRFNDYSIQWKGILKEEEEKKKEEVREKERNHYLHGRNKSQRVQKEICKQQFSSGKESMFSVWGDYMR